MIIAEGALRFDLRWDGKRVSTVEVHSTRVDFADRLLRGRALPEALGLVPGLYSLCRHAHSAAAQVAADAARGREADAAQERARSRRVLVEAIQESLRRLLLDWPAAVGVEGAPALLGRWYRHLAAVAADNARMDVRVLGDELAAVLRGEVFGAPLAEWLACPTLACLQSWWEATEAVAARLARALAHDRDWLPGELRLLPAERGAIARPVVAALRAEAGFARTPHWLGGPAETGALARWSTHPAVAEALDGHGNPMLARLLARLMELVAGVLALREPGSGDAHVEVYSPEPGVGVGMARTARGTLLHVIELDGARIGRYAIVAPTEWNFHPDGAFTRGMLGTESDNIGEIERRAALLAHLLDPCVGWQVHIHHA